MVWVFIRRQLCSFDGGLCVTKIHRKYSEKDLFFSGVLYSLMRFSVCLVRAFSLLGTIFGSRLEPQGDGLVLGISQKMELYIEFTNEISLD